MSGDIAVVDAEFTRNQQEAERRKRLDKALRDEVAAGSTDAEWEAFLAFCGRLSLDPQLKQAYWRKSVGNVVHSLGIDGYRAVADDSGEYAGQDAPKYGGHFELRPSKFAPTVCEVTVYRMVAGQRCAFVGQAHWQDFYNANNKMWNDLPYRMLAVRAEENAHKKAFPRRFSGVYSPDAIEDAQERQTATQATKPVQNGTQRQEEAVAKPAVTRKAIDAYNKAQTDTHIHIGRAWLSANFPEQFPTEASVPVGWHSADNEEDFLPEQTDNAWLKAIVGAMYEQHEGRVKA